MSAEELVSKLQESCEQFSSNDGNVVERLQPVLTAARALIQFSESLNDEKSEHEFEHKELEEKEARNESIEKVEIELRHLKADEDAHELLQDHIHKLRELEIFCESTFLVLTFLKNQVESCGRSIDSLTMAENRLNEAFNEVERTVQKYNEGDETMTKTEALAFRSVLLEQMEKIQNAKNMCNAVASDYDKLVKRWEKEATEVNSFDTTILEYSQFEDSKKSAKQEVDLLNLRKNQKNDLTEVERNCVVLFSTLDLVLGAERIENDMKSLQDIREYVDKLDAKIKDISFSKKCHLQVYEEKIRKYAKNPDSILRTPLECVTFRQLKKENKKAFNEVKEYHSQFMEQRKILNDQELDRRHEMYEYDRVRKDIFASLNYLGEFEDFLPEKIFEFAKSMKAELSSNEEMVSLITLRSLNRDVPNIVSLIKDWAKNPSICTQTVEYTQRKSIESDVQQSSLAEDHTVIEIVEDHTVIEIVEDQVD